MICGRSARLHRRLKSELIAKFIMFPDNEKKWKALVTEIVAAGRNETKHHEEVYPETMLAIYQLLGKVLEVLKVLKVLQAPRRLEVLMEV